MNNQLVFLNQGIGVLATILEDLHVNRIFLVTGKHLYCNLSKDFEKVFNEKDVFLFNNISENTEVSEIVDAIPTLTRFKPDVIIAVGGGKVIDFAKSINILTSQAGDTSCLVKNNAMLVSPVFCPLVVLPTTAGTGSEATAFSVLYIDGNKYSLASEKMLPDYVVIDSSLIRFMPNYVAACSAFDALSQSLESMWSANRTPESIQYAEHSIRLLLDNTVDSIREKTTESRKAMVEAAYYSGRSINFTKTTAPHALSYILTTKYRIPHGHAVACFIAPAMMVTEGKAGASILPVLQRIFDVFKVSSVSEFCACWYELMKNCGLAQKLSELKIGKDCVKQIADNVNEERLKNHPVPLSRDDIEKIIELSI